MTGNDGNRRLTYGIGQQIAWSNAACLNRDWFAVDNTVLQACAVQRARSIECSSHYWRR